MGGTAAAVYAKQRFSAATDHLVPGLRQDFDRIRESVEASPDWKTARVQPPVLILGSIDGVQVGYRQPRRESAMETQRVSTPGGELTLPTIDELIGMKAYMAYSRNATRDYVDFAALAGCVDDEAVLASLLHSDERYGKLQSSSAALEIAKRLCDPAPFDFGTVNLKAYKGLKPAWQDWTHTAEVCRKHGIRLTERLVLEE